MKRTKQDPRQHNYVRKMMYMAKIGALPRTVGLHQLTVFHDAWCGHFRGQRCDGDPDMEWNGMDRKYKRYFRPALPAACLRRGGAQRCTVRQYTASTCRSGQRRVRS